VLIYGIGIIILIEFLSGAWGFMLASVAGFHNRPQRGQGCIPKLVLGDE